MLYRDLKKTANESLFNPSKPDTKQRILLDVGNPEYYMTKALEIISEAKCLVNGSAGFNALLKEAITLLILARTQANEKKTKKPAKTRNNPPREDNKSS